MDAEQGLVHLDQLVYGLTYVMVWPDETNPTGVRITAESPYQVSHVWRPGAPRRVGAALKAYHDPLSDTWEAWLFTADEVQRYRASSRNDGGMPADEQWAPDGPAEPSPLPAAASSCCSPTGCAPTARPQRAARPAHPGGQADQCGAAAARWRVRSVSSALGHWPRGPRGRGRQPRAAVRRGRGSAAGHEDPNTALGRSMSPTCARTSTP